MFFLFFCFGRGHPVFCIFTCSPIYRDQLTDRSAIAQTKKCAFHQILGWSSCLRSPTNRRAVVCRLHRIDSPDFRHSFCFLYYFVDCVECLHPSTLRGWSRNPHDNCGTDRYDANRSKKLGDDMKKKCGRMKQLKAGNFGQPNGIALHDYDSKACTGLVFPSDVEVLDCTFSQIRHKEGVD